MTPGAFGAMTRVVGSVVIPASGLESELVAGGDEDTRDELR